MSTNAHSEFSSDNAETGDVPQGGETVDNSYVSSGNESVPVVKDDAPVEESNDSRNPDSDEALEHDDADAIDKSNIIKGDRTRHAKPAGTYQEPSDEAGLP